MGLSKFAKNQPTIRKQGGIHVGYGTPNNSKGLGTAASMPELPSLFPDLSPAKAGRGDLGAEEDEEAADELAGEDDAAVEKLRKERAETFARLNKPKVGSHVFSNSELERSSSNF